MYNITKLLANVSDQNKITNGDILSCVFLYAVRAYVLGKKEDAIFAIQDILVIGEIKETAEWEVMELAIFFLLFIKKTPAKESDMKIYLKAYRNKLLENLKQKKIDYVPFLKKENGVGIKKIIKKEVLDRLNGGELDNIREELEYNKKYEGSSELWVSKVKEVCEIIYLKYIRLDNNFDDVNKIILELKEFAKNDKIPPMVEFIF